MKRTWLGAALLALGAGMVGGAESRLPQGGGVIYPSWKAEHWANPKREGKPARMNYENRVAFDWGDWRPVLAALVGLTTARVDPIRIPGSLLNASTRSQWFTREGTDGNGAMLPTGKLSAGDAHFEIGDGATGPNAIMLAGAGSPVKAHAVTGIPANAKAGVLYFLAAFNPGPALVAWDKANYEAKARGEPPLDPPTLFRYVLHYADGRDLAIYARWDEAVNDWRRAGDWADPAYATTAWRKTVNELTVFNPPTVGLPTRFPKRTESLALYAFRFENPRPDVAIESIDLVSANTADKDFGAPALLAISTGPREYAGTTYYVAPDGSDANPGTFDKPWATPYKPAEAAGEGDTVCFRGGRYLLKEDWNAVVTIKGSGSKTRPLTFQSFPGETAVIDGDKHHCNLDAKTTPGPFDRDRGLVDLVGNKHVVLRNLWVENARKCGLGVFGCENVLLDHNTVYGCFHCGLNTGANNQLRDIGNVLGRVCSYRYVFNLTTQAWAPWEPDGQRDSSVPWPGGHGRKGIRPGREGIDDHNNTNCEIAFNEIYWCNKEAISDPTRNFKIHHNVIHHLPYERGTYWPSAIYLDAYGDGMRDMDVYDNVIYDACAGISIGSESGAPAEHIHIHHNLMANMRLQGLGIGSAGQNGPKRDVVIEYNTIYNAGFADFNEGPAGAVCLDSDNIEGLTFRYNIIQKVRDYNIVLSPKIDRVERRIVLRENLIGEAYPELDSLVSESARRGTGVPPAVASAANQPPGNGQDARATSQCPAESEQPSESPLNTERWIRRMRSTCGDMPVFGDAKFVNPEAGDFRLQADSPAVDATPFAEDPDGTAADFGAYARLAAMPPLPEAGKGYALRLICGSNQDYTDKQGRLWKSDRNTPLRGNNDYGIVTRDLTSIKGTEDTQIYITELYGGRDATFDVPPGLYTVRLHFAETRVDGPGKRIFSVVINNRPMIKNLDLYAEDGPETAVVKEFKVTAPVGKLALTLEQQVNAPIINGLEILQVTK